LILFLIGYRCTGKTTVGLALSEILNWSFCDTDSEVVQRSGLSIADMVAQKGWPFFRQEETRTLKNICQRQDLIVATGGGIILSAQNRQLLRTAGLVCWLQASAGIVLERMNADMRSRDMRPSLTQHDPTKEIKLTLAQRLPLYAAAADFAIDTDTIQPDTICASIVAEINDREKTAMD
jgi:shikimate kinase